MRRKSERTTASKKGKASPEKKVEKVKRTRSRRKKQSTSSENESGDDASPAPVDAPVEVEESKPPKTPVKEESPEEAQDQVWKVKAAAGSGNVGEIQKIKICLTRPPSTPERAERSPRSKRKHSRATSSSDTTSVEAPEEKEKRKSRRSKRSHRESKDEPEKNDSQEEEMETETVAEINTNEAITQSEDAQKTEDTSETMISTSNQGNDTVNVQSSEETTSKLDVDKEDKVSDADTTVVSPKVVEVSGVSNESAPPEPESSTQSQESQESKTESVEDQSKSEADSKESENKSQESENKSQDSDNKSQESENKSQESENNSQKSQKDDESQKDTEESQNESQDSINDKGNTEAKAKTSPDRRRSMSVDKSEILELHPEDSKCESDVEMEKSKSDDTQKAKAASHEDKVSKTEEKVPNKELKKDYKDTNVTGVVESSHKEKRERNVSVESYSEQDTRKSVDDNHSKLQRSDSTVSNQEESLPNGQAAPFVVSRKRRWGSRPSKVSSQMSITISTDVLKDIIPDVKPVEFEEVIEERKSKREVTEKIERPVLPKIIIDNTENIDRNEQRKEKEDKDKDVVKPRDSHLAVNRKISIVKDNESIIARPPSPPRHKQSCVLYITNLVRPFTLPQLKNLLQRTGRIVDNGFWIDKIKSKCFVVYETEDQAVETRHALHGVTWPVSNPKTLQVDFSTQEAFEKTKSAEENDTAPVSTIPGTVEDWLREQDQKRERGELDKPWERRSTREWDLGKNENDKEKENNKRREDKDRMLDKRRHRSPERSPEPARKFKKKEEEAPAKLLDDLFKKTKTTPCIYWLPLSAETIAIKEEQRRQHMAEHERRMQEQRRTHRRH